jgi:hypothetical protein
MKFNMKIIAVFHFSTGETVFAGPINGTYNRSELCMVRLTVNGEFSQTIEISGEFLMNARHPEDHRAIFTNQYVNLTTDFINENECSLETT